MKKTNELDFREKPFNITLYEYVHDENQVHIKIMSKKEADDIWASKPKTIKGKITISNYRFDFEERTIPRLSTLVQDSYNHILEKKTTDIEDHHLQDAVKIIKAVEEAGLFKMYNEEGVINTNNPKGFYVKERRGDEYIHEVPNIYHNEIDVLRHLYDLALKKVFEKIELYGSLKSGKAKDIVNVASCVQELPEGMYQEAFKQALAHFIIEPFKQEKIK